MPCEQSKRSNIGCDAARPQWFLLLQEHFIVVPADKALDRFVLGQS